MASRTDRVRKIADHCFDISEAVTGMLEALFERELDKVSDLADQVAVTVAGLKSSVKTLQAGVLKDTSAEQGALDFGGRTEEPEHAEPAATPDNAPEPPPAKPAHTPPAPEENRGQDSRSGAEETGADDQPPADPNADFVADGFDRIVELVRAGGYDAPDLVSCVRVLEQLTADGQGTTLNHLTDSGYEGKTVGHVLVKAVEAGLLTVGPDKLYTRPGQSAAPPDAGAILELVTSGVLVEHVTEGEIVTADQLADRANLRVPVAKAVLELWTRRGQAVCSGSSGYALTDKFSLTEEELAEWTYGAGPDAANWEDLLDAARDQVEVYLSADHPTNAEVLAGDHGLSLLATEAALAGKEEAGEARREPAVGDGLGDRWYLVPMEEDDQPAGAEPAGDFQLPDLSEHGLTEPQVRRAVDLVLLVMEGNDNAASGRKLTRAEPDIPKWTEGLREIMAALDAAGVVSHGAEEEPTSNDPFTLKVPGWRPGAPVGPVDSSPEEDDPFASGDDDQADQGAEEQPPADQGGDAEDDPFADDQPPAAGLRDADDPPVKVTTTHAGLLLAVREAGGGPVRLSELAKSKGWDTVDTIQLARDLERDGKQVILEDDQARLLTIRLPEEPDQGAAVDLDDEEPADGTVPARLLKPVVSSKSGLNLAIGQTGRWNPGTLTFVADGEAGQFTMKRADLVDQIVQVTG